MSLAGKNDTHDGPEHGQVPLVDVSRGRARQDGPVIHLFPVVIAQLGVSLGKSAVDTLPYTVNAVGPFTAFERLPFMLAYRGKASSQGDSLIG